MAGIESFGAYIPIYRLSRDEIARAWGERSAGGEKSIANYDEDSLTMAVEAATDCLTGIDRKQIDALYFASTTVPYRDKQIASILAVALDLRKDIFTMDISNSPRGATNAMMAAINAINSGSARKVLITASDLRVPAPKSEMEVYFGDGAAALLLSDSEVAVNIEGSYTVSSEFMDLWRPENERTYYTWEDRFIYDEGYLKMVPAAISEVTKKYGLTPKDFTKVVFNGPNARRHREVVRKIGLDAKTQVQDAMLNSVGDTGTASSLMILVAALEEAKPGDRILLANYGDGCDTFILRVTEQIEKIKGNRRGIKRHLASKMMLSNYEKYIRYRNLMDWEPERHPPHTSSLSLSWRESKQILALHGQKCKHCGGIQFPMQRVCAWCQTKGELEEVRLADTKGELFTFSMDERLAMDVDLPSISAVVNLDGGGRFWGIMTDRDPAKIEVGMPIELAFRKIQDSSGIHNYFWKARPVRC